MQRNPAKWSAQPPRGHVPSAANETVSEQKAMRALDYWKSHGGSNSEPARRPPSGSSAHIGREFNDRIGLYGEGLGGYVPFYLALAHAPIVSLICQNASAILTEPAYHQALLNDHGLWARSVRRRRVMLPPLRTLVRRV